MPDTFTPQQRHNCMSHIRSTDTKPEVRLRKSLFAKGLRYRVNVRLLPGSPDIVLPRWHSVIFVNGCFWHGHIGCSSYTRPKTNPEFWAAKVRRNQQRDEVVCARLESKGWRVITVWECELKKDRLEATVEQVVSTLSANKESWEQERRRLKADRKFAKALEQSRKEAVEEKERELKEQFHIPAKIEKASREDSDS